MRINNRIVIDLSKVTHAWNGWTTVWGDHIRIHKPNYPTIHGQEFSPDAKLYGSQETLINFAQTEGLLDVWIPYTTFQLSNNHSLTYTGDKAVSLWKAWNERIFNKKKGKK